MYLLSCLFLRGHGSYFHLFLFLWSVLYMSHFRCSGCLTFLFLPCGEFLVGFMFGILGPWCAGSFRTDFGHGLSVGNFYLVLVEVQESPQVKIYQGEKIRMRSREASADRQRVSNTIRPLTSGAVLGVYTMAI